MGGGSDGWIKVMPEVAKFTRVCAYDRAGEGKSDPAPRRLTHVRTGFHSTFDPTANSSSRKKADNSFTEISRSWSFRQFAMSWSRQERRPLWV